MKGINQKACYRFLTSYVHFYFIYDDQCFVGTHGVSTGMPTEHGCGLMRKQAYHSLNTARRVVGHGGGVPTVGLP